MMPGDVRRIVEGFARRRGIKLVEKGGALVLYPAEAPVYIEVRGTSRGVLVRLGHESIRDYVREVLDTEENPRQVIEDLVDDTSALAFELYEELRRHGIEARLDTRTAAMDILGELEEAEEE